MKRTMVTREDASDFGQEAGLLQVREGINYPCNETIDNMVLCPLVFTSKSLLSAETRCGKKHLASYMD